MDVDGAGSEKRPPTAAWSHAPGPNGGTPPAAVVEAARLGLPKFLKAIPRKELAHLNFSHPAEVEIAELGTPFRLFTIGPQQILDYDPATPLEQVVIPMPVWYFPVVVNGESRTLLYVERLHGTWKAAGVGSSRSAKLWAAAQGVRPTTDGYANVFVRVVQARAAFVLSTKGSGVQMIPLESAGMPPSETRADNDPADVIMGLKSSLRRLSRPGDLTEGARP
jgi:hypothetical protein